MSWIVVLVLVLLPAAMYGLAFVLNAARAWLGVTGLPRARSAARGAGMAGRAGPRPFPGGA
jgi:putative exporter of polyketide antibiotics